MTRGIQLELNRDDLNRLLFAIGYTQQGLLMEDNSPTGLIHPEKFDRLGDEIITQFSEQ